MGKSSHQQQKKHQSRQKLPVSIHTKIKHRLPAPKSTSKTKLKVYIINMSDIDNLEAFPAIKTVISEEWEERDAVQDSSRKGDENYSTLFPPTVTAHAPAPLPLPAPPPSRGSD